MREEPTNFELKVWACAFVLLWASFFAGMWTELKLHVLLKIAKEITQ